MPIFRLNNKLVFYAHVPKCAGTSIESYVERRFGPLSFLDRTHFGQETDGQWTRSSPQHIPAKALARLFRPGFFDASFALVRNPVDRFHSAFNFSKSVSGRMPRLMPLSAWLYMLERNVGVDHDWQDNHFVSQTSLIPEGARIFRIEDGLDALVSYLDDLAGNTAPDISIGHENTSAAKKRLTPGQVRRIERIYARDYEAFGYERQFSDG